jgi:hypothetical protein
MDHGMRCTYLAAAFCAAWAVTSIANEQLCTAVSKLLPLPGVPEASGVAASRRTPGNVWVHNDAGEPTLFAFDASGKAQGQVRISGVTLTDWEDLAAGSCREGSCLYVADIGDNHHQRKQIAVYRLVEPRIGDTTIASAESWAAAYPDGARDAEALFVLPSGQMFVVSKERPAATALYRFPLSTPGGGIGRLEKVSNLPLDHVTGASASPDGNWVALRTHHELVFYRSADLVSGANSEPRRFDLTPLGEPQGEGVAFGADGLIYLSGEGGGAGGTLVTLRCTLR